jgi:hypothetical protein
MNLRRRVDTKGNNKREQPGSNDYNLISDILED